MFKKIKTYEGSNNVVLEDEKYGNIQALLKWDGCIDFRYGWNGIKPGEDKTGENTDYIHICDIDEMIANLQALKEFGKKHFDNEFWE